MLRREVWRRSVGFRTDLAVAEDWEFGVRLFGLTEVGILDESLVLIHQLPGSLSSTPLGKAGDVRRAIEAIFVPQQAVFDNAWQRVAGRARALAVLDESCAVAARESGQLGKSLGFAARAAARWPPFTLEALRMMAVALARAARNAR
jgi:hypothetical protein